MGSESLEIIDGIKTLLRYHQICGIAEYYKNDDLDWFVSREQVATTKFVDKNNPIHYRSNEIQRADLSLDEIRNEIAACLSCNLASRRRLSIAGRGGEKARLFIVGEYLSVVGKVKERDDVIFGPEEDMMLSRMITALNLDESDAFVTNLVKCGLAKSDGGAPSKENFSACLPFLQRQINLVKPDVVCVMGTTAAQILLKSNRSLSQLRGRFYPYKNGASKTIMLMPTYHPTFLLKNEEMKKVTWVDLQAIGKRLHD